MAEVIQKGIFQQGFEAGEARGEAKGEAKAIMTFLKTKFERVPKKVQNSLSQITDSTTLESLAAQAVKCSSIDEFKKSLE